MYKFIETGKRHSENTDMVFVAIHCPKSIPYEHYHYVPKAERGKNIPLVLMLMRWDGCIGFPGGTVDPGETLMQALVREAKEEINFNLDPERATPLCSLAHLDGVRHIHCYEYPCVQPELLSVMTNAMNAEHFLAECQGCFAVQVANFEGGGGIGQFLAHQFKATAKMELVYLIQKYNWVLL